MSLKTFGFSAVARALAATAALGFGMASAPAAYAQANAYDTLVAAIVVELQNADGETAAQIRQKIAALIQAAPSSVNVANAFEAAKSQTASKWQNDKLATYDSQTYLAITEISASISYALRPPTGGTGGTNGGAAISNTTIGGAVAAGGHSN